ncbi:MAG: hypothetical protein MNPFHGCM_02936 [Gemmatimonadaceae bacterium]|nr:hypothetical protein [Gemmatimonadaceae bacterium]
MVQKKICLVGVFGTGKTSLVQRFVQSIFAVKYHSTIGVKVDRKEVLVDRVGVNLLLWDLAGRDADQDISPSYLRGSHGVFYVADGTRPETVHELDDLRRLVTDAIGAVPSIAAINKADLAADWKFTPADEQALLARDFQVIHTSAGTGTGVDDAFNRLARFVLAARPPHAT